MWFDLNSNFLSQSLLYYLDNYYEALRELKAYESPLIGYFTNKTPVELLDAMNLQPVRIFAFRSSKSQQGAYERYIQTFACSWLRDILDNGLVDGYSDLNCVLFSTGTCDSLQNVSDIWQKVFPSQLTCNLTFPIRNDSAASKYLENGFKQLISFFQAQFDCPTSMDLKTSIQKFNQKRDLLNKYALLVSTGQLRYSSFAKILYFGDILHVDDFLQIFIPVFESLNTGNQSSSEEKLPRLLVSGGMWDNLNLFGIPEFNGLVADDLSFGYRNFCYTLPESDSLETYSKAQISRLPEPTVYDEGQRLKSLSKQISTHNVDGVVLLTMKFCDPDAFELVPIRKYLDSIDVPYLNLETSPDLSNIGQLQTRLAAFTELLL